MMHRPSSHEDEPLFWHDAAFFVVAGVVLAGLWWLFGGCSW